MHSKSGFSLIELLVVIAVIGILASVGLIAYQEYINQVEEEVIQFETNEVANTLQRDLLAIDTGINARSNLLVNASLPPNPSCDAIAQTLSVAANFEKNENLFLVGHTLNHLPLNKVILICPNWNSPISDTNPLLFCRCTEEPCAYDPVGIGAPCPRNW